MSKTILAGLLAVAVAGGAWVGEAMGQRDAGAKVRGEFGTGYWGQGSAAQRSFTRPSYGPVYSGPASAVPGVESYRSFSYEPLAIAVGDEVTIQVPQANLMIGTSRVGTLLQGQTFKVTQVINGWLGAVVERDGRTLRGWVWNGNVRPQEENAPTSSDPRAQRPVERRSFSYEPTMST